MLISGLKGLRAAHRVLHAHDLQMISDPLVLPGNPPGHQRAIGIVLVAAEDVIAFVEVFDVGGDVGYNLSVNCPPLVKTIDAQYTMSRFESGGKSTVEVR